VRRWIIVVNGSVLVQRTLPHQLDDLDRALGGLVDHLLDAGLRVRRGRWARRAVLLGELLMLCSSASRPSASIRTRWQGGLEERLARDVAIEAIDQRVERALLQALHRLVGRRAVEHRRGARARQ
jgi:hypothetical protein